MAVNTYEAMFLIDSNKYASNPEGTLGDVTRILERVDAETLAARPWQDGKLAYPVEGRRKAMHYLVYIRLEGQNLAEMTRLCKLSPIVLRHLVVKLDTALIEPMVAVVTGEQPTKPAEAAVAAPGAATAQPSAAATAAETSAAETAAATSAEAPAPDSNAGKEKTE